MVEVDVYTPIKTIAAYYLDEVDKSEADLDSIWLLMLRGMIKMGYAFAAEPETARLPVPPNKIVPFPAGTLSWTKIGILDAQGQISTLKINSGLTKWQDTAPNRLEFLAEPNVNDSIGVLASAPVYLNYYNNNGYYNLFGVGGGLIQYGECTVDDENRRVVLSMDFRYDSIMFEAIYAPEKMNGDYQVKTSFTEMLIAFAKWKKGLGTRQDFYAEATEARRATGKKKVTLQTVNQVIRESQTMKLRS